MNEQNLIPMKQSSDEARENGRKGGIASGKARREKKAFREACSLILDMPIKSGDVKTAEEFKNLAELKGANISIREAVIIAQAMKALKGDKGAAEFLRDTAGEKPVDKIEQTNTEVAINLVGWEDAEDKS